MQQLTDHQGQAYNYFQNRSDRKRFLDQLLEQKHHLTIVKSVVQSTTYYAAVKQNDNVFAIISPTYVNDGEMTYDLKRENQDPPTQCPHVILKFLTPTDDQKAQKWRKTCNEYNYRQKKLNQAKKQHQIIRVRMHDDQLIDLKYDSNYHHWIEIEHPQHYLSKQAIINHVFDVIDYTI